MVCFLFFPVAYVDQRLTIALCSLSQNTKKPPSTTTMRTRSAGSLKNRPEAARLEVAEEKEAVVDAEAGVEENASTMESREEAGKRGAGIETMI